MASYHSQNGSVSKSAFPMSTLESDDACAYPGFSYDSGLGSLSEYSSLNSTSVSRALDGTTTLAEKLNTLTLLDEGKKTKRMNQSFVSVDDFRPANSSGFHSAVPELTQLQSTVDYSAPAQGLMAPYPFTQDEDGDTQLHLAIILPNPSVAFRLIEAGQFTDQLDLQNDLQQTPLHLAVVTNQPALVRALFISGASSTARDKQGNIPLHLACKLGHAECVEKLTTPPSEQEEHYMRSERQRRGLDPRSVNWTRSGDVRLLNYEGDTCLHLALSSVANTKLQVIHYLLNNCGVDVNLQEGKCGFTLLHQAVRSRDLEAVEFLLQQRNVSVNQCCYNGYTPLDFALSQRHELLANVLLGVGAVSFVAFSGSEQDSFQDNDFDDLVIAGSCAQSGSRLR